MIEITACKSFADTSAAYGSSFGNLPDQTPYNPGWSRSYQSQMKGMSLQGHEVEVFGDGMRGIMYKARCEMKATTTTIGTGGATIQALIPIAIDPRIVDVSRKFTPLTELVPRVSNQGIVAAFVRITAKGAANTAVEDASLSETNNTIVQDNEPIKYLYSIGRVTGQAQAAIPAYVLGGFSPAGAGNVSANPFSDQAAPNAMQLEVLTAARALKELEEDLLINGNKTTSAISGNPDGTEFDGIIQLQSTTNQTDLSGSEMTFDDVEDTVELAYVAGGRPNLAVASPAALTKLRKIMIDTFRMGPSDNATELTFGISAQLTLSTIVGSIPVIPSMFLSNSAAARRIYFLDMDWIEVRVLLDMTFEELAKTNDSRKFMLKIYETLLLRAPEFNASIIGIA